MQTDTDDARAEQLQHLLHARALDCTLQWCAQIDSTNAELLRRVRAHPGAGAQCLVAGTQSAGRGRQGRRWIDADAAVLTSLAWPFAAGTPLDALSLACGVWLAQTLQALGACGVGLKWRNDVLLRANKLAGVLVELADTQEARWAVIGIGVNLRLPDGVDGAAALEQIAAPPTRWELLEQLLPTLLQGLGSFALSGFAPWQPAWNALHAWHGDAVRVIEGGQTVASGVACGVDASGCLLLETDGGILPVRSGDVSLRRLAG